MKQANNRRANLRELPAYSVAEVAHYLNIPRSTVRYWATGKDSSPALIEVADTNPVALSFLNLVELHVLLAKDYDREKAEIEEAIRCELRAAA